jgi:MFS family permease
MLNSIRMPKWIAILLISSSSTLASISLIRPMITYRALEIGATPAQIGVLGAVYALFPIVLALFLGKNVGRFGEAKYIVFGASTMFLLAIGFAFIDSLFLLMVATAAIGISHLVGVVGGQTMISTRSPNEKLDGFFGYYAFGASVGQMVGPLVGGIVAGSDGVLPKSTATGFLAAAGFALVALLPTFYWRNQKIAIQQSVNQSGTFTAAVSMLKQPGMAKAVYISLAVSSAVDVLIVFLPLFGTENNFSPFSVGVILAIRAGTSMLSRIFLGAISQRLGSHFLMLASIIASTIFCAAMFFARSPISLGIAVAVAGLALGVGQPLTMALVSRIAPPEERALAISARLTANRVGQFVVPASAGAIAGAAGSGSVFLGLAALLASSIFTAL